MPKRIVGRSWICPVFQYLLISTLDGAAAVISDTVDERADLHTMHIAEFSRRNDRAVIPTPVAVTTEGTERKHSLSGRSNEIIQIFSLLLRAEVEKVLHPGIG